VVTGKQQVTFQPSQGEGYSIVFSPDGQRVALWPKHVASVGEIWDVQAADKQSTPLGKGFLGKGSLGKGPLGKGLLDKLFDDVREARLLKTIKGHTAGVVQLAFSADGTRLYSADGHGTLKEWDSRTAVPKRRSPGPIVKQSKDGARRLVSQGGSDTDISVRDGAGKELFTFTKHQATVVCADISANGRYALSQDAAGELKVWETGTGEVLLERPYRLDLASRPTMFSADGRRFAAALPEGGVKVWELEHFREILAIPDVTHVVQWSPDCQRLLTTHRSLPKAGAKPFPKDRDGFSPKHWEFDLKLWDVDANKQLHSSKFLYFVQFSPDGKRLAFTLRTGGKAPGSFAVKVLDGTTGAELATFEVDDAGPAGPGPLVFSPDHNRLAAGNSWDDVLVWDIPARKQVFHLKGHLSNVDQVAFSPDGRRLASMTGNRFRFTTGSWSKGEKGGFFGGGRTEDCELILWDMATGSELMRVGVGPPAFAGLSFSPDGHRLAIGGAFDDPRTLSQVLDATPRAAAPATKADGK
jgi:WD40 repeat protein